jgi:perosamine synthetase
MPERVPHTAPIPWARPLLFGEEKSFLLDALESTMLSGGAYVERLETEFAQLHGLPGAAISVSNGTAALYLALLGLGVGPQDEVIVPGWCFAAAANMALACGAQPVFADVRADTWLIDPGAVEKLITPRTKAVIAVHTYGVVAEMPALAELARRHGLALIEDCAEALFSRLEGRLAGAFGDVSCFSFQATKTVTCGEGGMVLVQDAGLRERMRLIRNHGMRPERKYWHCLVGHNFRLTNLQAAVACAQLAHREEIVRLRARLWHGYRQRLSGAAALTFQHVPAGVEPVIWAVAVRLDPAECGVSRDAAIEQLAQRGVETRPGFHAFSEQPLYRARPLPNAAVVAPQVLSLPSAPDLSDAELDYISETLRELLSQASGEPSVLEHYRAQARAHGASSESTMPDEVVRGKELEAILTFLERAPAGRLLEIGCGNGLLLEAIAGRFGGRFALWGIDLTPEMVAVAAGRSLECALQVGDVRRLPYKNGCFDVVVAERVIINVREPAGQAQAFEEIARVLRPGGVMVAIEGFQEGLENLNRARADFLLPPIPEPAVNNWFTEERWRQCLAAGFREFTPAEAAELAPENFLSSHYFMTRFFHDAIRPAAGKVRNTELARFFAAALPPVGDYAPLRVKYLRRVGE